MATDAARLYIALYTDADVHGELAEQLRAREYDALSAVEAGNADLSDLQQLEFAISQGRAILTFNIQDFEPLHKHYVNSGRDHFGIAVCDQIPIGEVLRRVINMLDQIDAEQMKNTYHHLGEFK